MTSLQSKEVNELTCSCDLSSGDVARFSRQIVLPEFGVSGQISLRDKSFLVVGAGGLGCTAVIHLAGSGAGKITIVDHDSIDITNLHRQIMYSASDVGNFKARVLAGKCIGLNPSCEANAICELLTVENATQLVQSHDIILDCTDNVYARYLLNDACVLEEKALVSASALKFEGQLTVYNHNGSPCRRCLFPNARIMQTHSCDDNGVMGPVPGIMGSLQAMEAIKVAAGIPVSFAGVTLHYNALFGTFHRIKLRLKNPSCPVCASEATITKLHDDHLGSNTCLLRPPDVPLDSLLPPTDRVTAKELKESLQSDESDSVLIDVRSSTELEICRFRNSFNIPIESLYDEMSHEDIRQKLEKLLSQNKSASSETTVTVICRRGNDSQIAVHILRKILAGIPVRINDLAGGLYDWHKHIDSEFPLY